jgi:heme/copper-type cytochrome/quinol oxidase subunit 3
VNALPWTYDVRTDTGTTSVRLGMWLFLASEAMFFASLFSAYVLLRTGSAEWPDAAVLGGWTQPALLTGVLGATTVSLWLTHARAARSRSMRWPLLASAGLAVAFVVLKAIEYRAKLDAGLLPASNLLLACWYTLTAVHAAHVAAGALANLWVAARSASARAGVERVRALRLYWAFVDLVWIALLVSFYVV